MNLIFTNQQPCEGDVIIPTVQKGKVSFREMECHGNSHYCGPHMQCQLSCSLLSPTAAQEAGTVISDLMCDVRTIMKLLLGVDKPCEVQSTVAGMLEVLNKY